MTIKELSQLYHLNREIEQDRQRLDELRRQAIPGAQVITGMPHAPGAYDRVGKYATEIADLEGVIDAKMKQCFYELNRLNRYIAGVEDSQIRQILTLRFINGLNWLQVARSIGGNNTMDSVKKTCYRYLGSDRIIK